MTNLQKKSPLRVCHLADVHLGYRRYNKLTKSGMNQREVDVNLAFQEAIGRIISLRPDVTIIAGDLFHSVRPSNSVVTFCFRQLRRLARDTGSPIVVVGGNHEAPKRSDTGSVLQLFAEIDGVHVADTSFETFTFKEKGLSVACLPHLALLEREKLQLRANDRYPHNILVVHAQVNEPWVSDFGGVEIELSALLPHEWDYIALGHVHLHRTVGLNAAYPGAIEHTAANIWGESRELKGFLEVQLPSTKRTFHPLTSPREVVLLEPIDAAGLEPQDLTALIVERGNSIAGGIDGKIVRLEIRNVSRESYRHLDHREIRNIRARALNLTLDLGFAAQSGNTDALIRTKAGSLREELQSFCKTWEIPGVTSEEISSTLLTYLSKVEAKYEAP
jgi:DNA repair exonuclease SbcCD nuclease subunit